MVAENDYPLEYLEFCPLCHDESFSLFAESNGFRIVECPRCTLKFVNPRPSEQEIKNHFENEYIDDEKRVDVDFTSYREKSLHREAEAIKKLLDSGGRLLDLGAASGYFLSCFSDSPEWDVEGVEPSRYAAASAQRKYGVNVHQGFLSDQNFAGEAFDIITSLDSFCFHPNPGKDLREIVRILKPGGFFCVEIPGLNFRLLKNKGLVARLVYGERVRLNAGVHLFYYSRSTLGAFAEKFGLEESCFFPEQSPLYGNIAIRFLNHAYYLFSAATYRLSNGNLNVVPKEFIIYRKVI